MLWAAPDGGLELRREGGDTRLRGRFPYNSRAVLSDGGRRGRPRKEQFASHAFKFSVDSEARIDLLAGHSFDRPLASRANGTLDLVDTAEALTFTARILPELMDVAHVRDTLTMIGAGLAVGVSPGFRIPPPAAVPPEEAETVEEEDPSEGRAIIRTIRQAILFELSVVSRPAYPEAQVEARDWTVNERAAAVSAQMAKWRRLRQWAL
ncbi:MAG: HK97 family phage prohead protease [Pseudomonadota bacterium]